MSEPRRTAAQLARAVERGRNVAEALRYLDSYGRAADAPIVALALARFLVARCESHHAGWRVLRQVVVDSVADAPWEKCARRAVQPLADDLIALTDEGGRTPLARAQHLAARHRAEQIATHVDPSALLAQLELKSRKVSAERWQTVLGASIGSRSREQLARNIERALKA